MMRPGPRNLITDVDGLAVGNAEDTRVRTGVTVILCEDGTLGAVDRRGGAPGTRETDALDPACLVERVDAIVLAGGSVHGLEAASSVTTWLAERGRGFVLGPGLPVAPIVPAAILFDLGNGGGKDWGATPPYGALGRAAADAAGPQFALGNAGAGFGAIAGAFKGGLGSASIVTPDGITVGALAAANPVGSPAMPGSGVLWAAPFELDGEMGGQRLGRIAPAGAGWPDDAKLNPRPGGNTTIACVATDARLTKAEAERLAIMAQDGLARAVRPAHTYLDGDTVFALATGKRDLPGERALAVSLLGHLAADCLARAIGRAVFAADTLGGVPSWRAAHPDAFGI